MLFTRLKIRNHFQISRIKHGVSAIFHPTGLKNGGTSVDRTGIDEHVALSAQTHNKMQNTGELIKDDLCSERYFIPNLEAKHKVDAIEKLSKVLKSHPGMIDHKKFLSDVLKRENLKSTGLGYHVAIPHARSEYVNQILMAVGKSNEGIQFDSPDQSISHYIVLIGTPIEHVKGYLKLLAGIARMFKNDDIREKLLESDSCEEMASIFRTNLEKWKI